MSSKPSYEMLEEKIQLLEKEAEQRRRFEKINSALFSIANAVNTTLNQDELFCEIHDVLASIIDTTNFYIALYDNDKDAIDFAYIVDSVDKYYPSALNVSKTGSLTGEVIRTKSPLLIDKKDILSRRDSSPYEVPSCTPAELWLGVPLQSKKEIIGVMAVQSYLDPHCYDQTDLEVMVAVSDQVAIALDRKQKEDALIESEARFRRIVTTANEGIVSINEDWCIVYTNEHFAKMLGYSREELSGKPLQDLIWEKDHADFAAHQEARVQGIHKNFERAFKKRNGDLVRTIVSATSILDAQNRFVGSFGMVTDITAQKNAEEQLQQTVKQLQLAADQIKTLRGIVPICMNCKKIRDDQGFWQQVEEYVRAHTEVEFSHGVCPDCIRELYPDMYEEILGKRKKQI